MIHDFFRKRRVRFCLRLQDKSAEKINSKICNLSPLNTNIFFQLLKKVFFKSYEELWNVNP